MNNKPKVLELVENQTGKSYGVRKGGKRDIILPPIFESTGICIACGKEKHVNVCGFCKGCWVTFSHFKK